MAVLAGKDGSVKIGANTVAEIDNWSFDAGFDLADTTAFGESWKRQNSTLGGCTGSFSGRHDMSDTAQDALQTAVLTGATVALSLLTVTGDRVYSGNAFVRFSPKADVSSTVDVDYSFTVTGEWAFS